jgi:cytochrome c peroxidase
MFYLPAAPLALSVRQPDATDAACRPTSPAPGAAARQHSRLAARNCVALALGIGFCLATATRLRAADTELEFEPAWGGQSLYLNREYVAPGGARFTFSRLDLLVADIALLKEDGTWLESRDWVAFLSLGQHRLRATLEGVPAQPFQKIRFSVGLRREANLSDPNQYPPGHALHPQENGLHWGWQGGYVFLAAEGRVQPPPGGHSQDTNNQSGFSYHLGNTENRVTLEIPAALDGARARTVRLKFDVAQLFAAKGSVLPWRDGTSTHSRPGDPVLPKLKSGLNAAFTLAGISTDSFQPSAPPPASTNSAPSFGTPRSVLFSARLPKVSLPPDNPLTVEGTTLGERLFHEPRLSRDDSLACSSCHQQERAFADGAKRFSLGVDGQEGRRNAMPLFNLAWQREFFWDGRVAGLRHQTLAPIQDAHEMAASLDAVVEKLQRDPAYPELFRRAFGEARITPERLGLALEQFLLTLVSQNSKFDRAARGETELSDLEKQGLRLFVTEYDPARDWRGADCFHCHGGNLFTSGAYANNGLDRACTDLGRFAVTHQDADRGRFRVPSLRNVEVTAPYMHDGRFKTLEEVVDHYNSGIQPSPTLDPNLAKHPQLGLNLSVADKKALVAFLKTLTDENFIHSTTNSTPNLTQR